MKDTSPEAVELRIAESIEALKVIKPLTDPIRDLGGEDITHEINAMNGRLVTLYLEERSRIRAEVLEARIDELRLIIKETELFSKKRSHYVSQVYLKINYLTRRVDELHSELATLREQQQEKS